MRVKSASPASAKRMPNDSSNAPGVTRSESNSSKMANFRFVFVAFRHRTTLHTSI